MYYIVARMGGDVVIRQVTATSCKFPLSRNEAWGLAVRLATPRKIHIGKQVRKVEASPIYFVDLEMNHRLVREKVERANNGRQKGEYQGCVSLRTGKHPVRPDCI